MRTPELEEELEDVRLVDTLERIARDLERLMVTLGLTVGLAVAIVGLVLFYR